MASALRMLAIGMIAIFSSLAVAQVDSCLHHAADLAALEACTDREVRPLEEQFIRGTKRLLSNYSGAEADMWNRVLAARESWRHNNCLTEGEVHALRSGNYSTLERRRGFAICKKRMLQSLLLSLADCERTSSLCERAMSMEGAGYEPRSAEGATPQLTEAQKQLMDQSNMVSAQARVSYCSGRAWQAVADLERSIPLREQVHKEILSSLSGSDTLLNYALLLDHGRLVKLHRSLGNLVQSEKHETVARSLKIGEKYVADPLALVSDDDANYCAGLN